MSALSCFSSYLVATGSYVLMVFILIFPAKPMDKCIKT